MDRKIELLRDAMEHLEQALGKLGDLRVEGRGGGETIDWLYYAIEHADDALAALKYRVEPHMEGQNAGD